MPSLPTSATLCSTTLVRRLPSRFSVVNLSAEELKQRLEAVVKEYEQHLYLVLSESIKFFKLERLWSDWERLCERQLYTQHLVVPPKTAYSEVSYTAGYDSGNQLKVAGVLIEYMAGQWLEITTAHAYCMVEYCGLH